MKNNYPIKYAVIPIIEQVGWENGVCELERKYGTVCYIVSKCYVVEESKKYNINGTTKIEYQVVCPFSEDEYYTWRREEPSYNLVYGHCTNSVITDALFDSLDEAKAAKNKKNEDILLHKSLYMSSNAYKEQRIEEKFNEIISHYNRLEKEIEKRTQDLIVNNSTKEQRIIRLINNEVKKINSSLYSEVNIFDSSNYIVYSLTNEEFAELQELSTDSESLKKFNHTPLLINNGQLKTTKVISPNGEEMYLVNNELFEQIDTEFITPSNYDEVFYTIEDYEDIIKSYVHRYDNSNVIRLVRK